MLGANSAYIHGLNRKLSSRTHAAFIACSAPALRNRVRGPDWRPSRTADLWSGPAGSAGELSPRRCLRCRPVRVAPDDHLLSCRRRADVAPAVAATVGRWSEVQPGSARLVQRSHTALDLPGARSPGVPQISRPGRGQGAPRIDTAVSRSVALTGRRDGAELLMLH